jgi:hypothetical protein
MTKVFSAFKERILKDLPESMREQFLAEARSVETDCASLFPMAVTGVAQVPFLYDEDHHARLNATLQKHADWMQKWKQEIVERVSS